MNEREIKNYANGKLAASIYSVIFNTVGVTMLAGGYWEGVIPVLVGGAPTSAMAVYYYKQQRGLESKVSGSLENISEGLDRNE